MKIDYRKAVNPPTIQLLISQKYYTKNLDYSLGSSQDVTFAKQAAVSYCEPRCKWLVHLLYLVPPWVAEGVGGLVAWQEEASFLATSWESQGWAEDHLCTVSNITQYTTVYVLCLTVTVT